MLRTARIRFTVMSQPLSALLAAGPDGSQPDRTHRRLVAQRLAEAVAAAHAAGGVIGNLDDQRVLVEPDGTVTLGDNEPSAARASAPAYTAPELQGAFASHTRGEAQHDLFALAVLIFQLLMEGNHPYAGQWVGGGNLPEIPKAIQLGLYAYGGASVTPPPGAPALGTLDPGIAELFKRSFGATSAIFRSRPTGAEWARALEPGGKNAPESRQPLTAAPPDPAYESVAQSLKSATDAAGPPSAAKLVEPSTSVRQMPNPVLVQPDPLTEPAGEPASIAPAPEPIASVAQEETVGDRPEAPPDAAAPHRPISEQEMWLPTPPAPASIAAQPTARVPARPAKRSFSRRALLKQVIPVDEPASTSHVAVQPKPTFLENFFSEIGWLVESELRWLMDIRIWGSILTVIFGFLFVLSLLAFLRPDDQASPRTQPAITQGTRIPATQTPQPQPTATRAPVLNPAVASFENTFDDSDEVIPVTGERFAASVHHSTLHMEASGRGGRGWVMFNAAPASEDFTFTVRVGVTTGQGEMLIYVRKPESGRTWVFAVDPAANTWGIYEEPPWSTRPLTVMPHQGYSSAVARDPLRFVTVTREGGRMSLRINGIAVAPRVAGSMPRIGGPVQVGVGVMIPEEPVPFEGDSFVVTVDRVTMLEDRK